MSALTLAFQHVLATPLPAALAGSNVLAREMRGRMRMAALRWRTALELGERELAQDCLANAVQWRDAAADCGGQR